MLIKEAKFTVSNSDPSLCPPPDRPEYAFIGRSNVGKSSLINMLTARPTLAKTSSTPGKTQLINHFEINGTWYLVDLPGYGFAQVGQAARLAWEKSTRKYLSTRESLLCIFVLIDSRLEPLKPDREFMAWLAKEGLPFVIVFTKADKQSAGKTKQLLDDYCQVLLEDWEELPRIFLTSAEKGWGRDEVLDFIEETNKLFVAEPKLKGRPKGI